MEAFRRKRRVIKEVKEPMGETDREVVEAEEILGYDFNLPLVETLLKVGKKPNRDSETLFIKGARFNQAKFGEYGIMELDNGGEYRVSSDVLIPQLKALQPYFLRGQIVQAVLKEVPTVVNGEATAYYTLGKRPEKKSVKPK